MRSNDVPSAEAQIAHELSVVPLAERFGSAPIVRHERARVIVDHPAPLQNGSAMTDKTPRTPQPRTSERVSLEAEVVIRRTGTSSQQVKIGDLSKEGYSFEFVLAPRVDDRVWLRMPPLESIAGSVRWVDGLMAGVQFDRSLHPAIFDLLLQRMRNR